MFSLLAGVLAFFYDLVPNFAIAITLLTLTVMLVLTPITLKGTRSMLALQKLQPEMKRLQDEHKGDKQALNEAMVAFYKEHKINPLSGCLPLIAQFPVLIVMFRVIRGLVQTKNGVANPAYVGKSTALYKALVHSKGKMVSFGMDFAAKAASGGRDALPLYLLIALVVATGYWQVKQMQSRAPQSAAANPQAQMMTKVMPLFSGLISFTLPGGVTLYFLVSNLFRIAQQSLMYRFDPNLREHLANNVRDVKSRETTPKPSRSLFGSGGSLPSNGNGAPTPKPTKPKPITTGRVTPAGRPGSGRKKNKRRR